MPLPGYTDPYADEAAEIERKRRYAEALRAQSFDPVQPYSVGGQAGPISWTQGAAKMLQGFNAGQAGKAAEEQARALRERVQTDRTADMSALAAALRGSPGGMQADAADNVTQMPARPAGQIDPAIFGQLRSPDMQGLAMQMFAKQMQPKAPLKGGPGDQFLHPDTLKPLATIPHKPEKPAALPSAIQEYEYAQKQGFKGTFQEFELSKRKAGAPSVVTNVSTEKKYGEQFAGQIAKADSDMRDAAIKAPQLAERSNMVKQLLAAGNVKTGTAADFRLQFAKAAQLAGFGDGSAAATEQVSVALAQNTLDAIKASGLGSGSGFSNADRDFLEKAVGGKITLERATLERLADLSHRAASETAKRWNTRVKQIPRTALEGTGITQDDVKVPPLFGAKPAAGASGDDPLGLRR